MWQILIDAAAALATCCAKQATDSLTIELSNNYNTSVIINRAAPNCLTELETAAATEKLNKSNIRRTWV